MKHYYNILALCGALAIMGTTMTACGGDDDKIDDGDGKIIDKTGTDVLSIEQQQAKIDAAMSELLQAIQPEDFKTLANVVRYARQTVAGYDWSEVEEWAETLMEDAMTELGSSETATESYEGYGGITYITNNTFEDYRALLLFSNFTGHFEAVDGQWHKSEADDLQFTFADGDGQPCTLKLATSGAVKNVHVTTDITDLGDSYTDEGQTIIYDYYYACIDYVIGIPEEVTLSLTRGDETLAKTTIKSDLREIKDEEFDFRTSLCDLTATTELKGGYQLATRLTYTGNNESSNYVRALAKGDKQLAIISITGKIIDAPELALSEIDSPDYDVQTTLKAANVLVELWGKVRIQGHVADVNALDENLKIARKWSANEQLYKTYLDKVNDLLELYVRYDGHDKDHAFLTLEPFIEADGRTWSNKLVINFYDGSSYCTMDDFFTQKAFKGSKSLFEEIVDEFARL
ncbi:MAG: hypothetical protein J6W69_06770 [Bacteroidales bacterium]|nr:hypothetical protein [Bacteroidales bacterium]